VASRIDTAAVSGGRGHILRLRPSRRSAVYDKDHARRAAYADEIVIRGLARDQDLEELFDALVVITAKGDMVVGVNLIRLAADALGLGGFSSTDPLEYERLCETYLPEIEFRGRVSHRNSQYALHAAAALRGGVLPDLYADAGWWQGELWEYALYAVVAYVRASAEKRSERAADVARALAVARGVSVE
jgi:hypothetical protein